MNISIIVSSFKYLNSNFDLTICLSTWIYPELSRCKYTDKILIKSYNTDLDFEITESIIHLNTNKDVLNNLLYTVVFCEHDEDFKKRTKLLLKNGATDIHFEEEYILFKSCICGYIDIVKLALKSGADVGYYNNCLIKKACNDNCVALVRLFLKYGADVHVDNESLLKRACAYKQIKLIILLLDYGADAHVDDDKLIKCAVYYGFKYIADLLTHRNKHRKLN